jgi:hypothetical protein
VALGSYPDLAGDPEAGEEEVMGEMYQVVIRCTEDDVPALLTADRDEAFRVVEDLHAVDGKADWLEIDWNELEFVRVVVITFRDGRPVRTNGIGPPGDDDLPDAMGDQPAE